MFDPQTVAFSIRAPWFRRWPDGTRYHPEMITIWHVDPCKDGSDDSCGFSYPKLTKKQRARLRDFAFDEGSNPYFLRAETRHWEGSPTDGETLYRALVLLAARALRIRMSLEEATVFAIERVHNGGFEGAASAFCWVPGYHCNGSDSPDKRREQLAGAMAGIARELLRRRRPWWRRPRWHVHHWRLQVIPLQSFKRWAFSRCAGCGKGFGWGYCPTSTSWDGTGPQWFRSERHVYHSECSGVKAAANA